jgi:hypothetical protein
LALFTPGLPAALPDVLTFVLFSAIRYPLSI